jgi:LPS sulfotransferase NodH
MTTPHTTYIICATPRSGSSVLCEGLKNTFLAGRPEEYFNTESERIWRAKWKIDSSDSYFRWLIDHGTSPNGVFGVKIMWEQMGYCIRFLRQLPQYQNPELSPSDFISTAFGNLFYIWITRRDKIRQAISTDIAIQTGNYAWTSIHEANPHIKPTFNYNRINFLYHRILAAEDGWHQYFNDAGVTPFKVVYEDFIATYEGTVGAILDYLEITVPANHIFASRKLKKMSDATNEDWVRRFNEMKACEAENSNRIHRQLAKWLA